MKIVFMFLPASFSDRALARDPESSFVFELASGFRVRLLSLAPRNDRKRTEGVLSLKMCLALLYLALPDTSSREANNEPCRLACVAGRSLLKANLKEAGCGNFRSYPVLSLRVGLWRRQHGDKSCGQ
jgi:hypothetical protein